MKSAIYINEGTTQVVLTPENQWEESTLKMISGSPHVLQTYYGQFYECLGGWYRRDQYAGTRDSLIFRIDKALRPPMENQ